MSIRFINVGFGNIVSANRLISMDSDHVILSAVQPETVANRLDNKDSQTMEDDEES